MINATLQTVDSAMVAIHSQADRCVADRPVPRPDGLAAVLRVVGAKAMVFLSSLRATLHDEESIRQRCERSLKALAPCVKTV